MSGDYTIERRTRPKSLQRRKLVFGLPVGAKQDYERPWMLLKDGKPMGFYAKPVDAVIAMPPVEGETIDEAVARLVIAIESTDVKGDEDGINR